MISHPGVERTYAANGCVQFVEELVGDACGNLGAVTEGQSVLMRDDHTIGFLDGCADGVPIIGSQAAQVDDLDAEFGVRALHLHGRLQSLLDYCAVSNDGEALAGLDHFGAAEGDGEIRAGIWRSIVRLAIKALVFEEEYGIVRADCSSQEPASIQRSRGHD